MTKECGTCNLCCKYPDLPGLSPAGELCCNSSGGRCSIYESRPKACRNFTCIWFNSHVMGEELRPDRCGIMFELFNDERTVLACVDEDKAEAWKNGEPKKLIQQMVSDGYAVWVVIGKDRHLILPYGQTAAEATARVKHAWRRTANGIT